MFIFDWKQGEKKEQNFQFTFISTRNYFTNNLTPDDVPILICLSNKMFHTLTYGLQLDLVAAYQWMVIALLFLVHLLKTHKNSVCLCLVKSIYRRCLIIANFLLQRLTFWLFTCSNEFCSSSYREWTERSLPNEVDSPNVASIVLICLHCYQLLWISSFWGSDTWWCAHQFRWWSWNSI